MYRSNRKPIEGCPQPDGITEFDGKPVEFVQPEPVIGPQCLKWKPATPEWVAMIDEAMKGAA